MKKSVAIALAFLSATAIANEPAKKSEPVQFVNQPMMQLEVFDSSNKVQSVVKDRKLSVSNKSHSLCWIAYNMPLNVENKIQEVFISPSKSIFKDPGASNVVSDDGKKHTIIRMVPSVNNEFIQRCWNFDKNDPLGQYSLELRVNDAQFPAQRFELVK